jgi:ATP-dependent RNA helicase DeaD
MEAPPLALVFCNTKKRVDEISEKLQSRGYFAEALHGDLKQSQRDMVMKKFRSRTLEVLVATDVAARGIDVDDIAIVFNYDLPQDEEYYIHRIGRTGRAGKQGKAITFAAGRDLYRLREIMHYAKIKVAKGKMPTLKEIEEVKTRQFTDKLKGIIDEGYLDKYKGVVEAMSEYNPMEIAAALFKMNLYDDTAKEIIFEEPKKPQLQSRKQEFSKREFSDDKNMARLYLTVGKKDMVKPGDIVGAITGEAGVPGKSIGHIDIYEEFTFVDIPKKIMPKVLNSMSHVKIKGKKIKAEWARPKRYSKNG